MDTVDLIMEYEQGTATPEDTLRLFSELIRSGQAWELQGHYGRVATALIQQGYIDRNGDILKGV